MATNDKPTEQKSEEVKNEQKSEEVKNDAANAGGAAEANRAGEQDAGRRQQPAANAEPAERGRDGAGREGGREGDGAAGVDGRRSGAEPKGQRGHAAASDERELEPLRPRELSRREEGEREAAAEEQARQAELDAQMVEAVGRMSPRERAALSRALVGNDGHPGSTGGDGSLSFHGRIEAGEALAAAPAPPPIIRTANRPRTPIAAPPAPVPSPDNPDTTLRKNEAGVITRVGHLEREG